MAKKARLPQSRRHILVYDEDWEWLDTHFGATSPRPIGVGPSCREIIHKHVQDIKAKFQEALDTRAEAESLQPEPQSPEDDPWPFPSMVNCDA